MQKTYSNWRKWTPVVSHQWLYLIAGIIWSGVGIFLCSLTPPWLSRIPLSRQIVFISAGGVLALLIYLFGFSKFAEHNIVRIQTIAKKRICVFAFQKWSSYPLVVFMIGLGIFLRKYSPVPKSWLAILYLGIGGSLFLASFRYYAAIAGHTTASAG